MTDPTSTDPATPDPVTPDPITPDPARAPERVSDYPRPPRLEPDARRVRIVLGGVTIADSTRAWRVCETHHPPTFYLPPGDVLLGALRPAEGASFCEWKGSARYWTLEAGGRVAERAAWSYPAPTPHFRPIRDFLAFYPAAMDACFVGNDRVEPQPGGFYGGWITPELIGPFKGGPGTLGW